MHLVDEKHHMHLISSWQHITNLGASRWLGGHFCDSIDTPDPVYHSNNRVLYHSGRWQPFGGFPSTKIIEFDFRQNVGLVQPGRMQHASSNGCRLVAFVP